MEKSALKDSWAMFRNIFVQSPIGIELYDADGLLIDANSACLDIFGISDVSEVKGFSLFDDPNVTDEIKNKLRRAETVRYETLFDFNKIKENDLYQTTKSETIYLDVLITPIQADENEPLSGYMVQVQDITKSKNTENALRKAMDELEQRVQERTRRLRMSIEMLRDEITERARIEESLKKSREQLADAQQVARLGSWEWDIDTNTFTLSNELLRIFGLKPEEFDATYEAFLGLVHPGDKEAIEKAVRETLNEKKPYSIDHRIVCPDGKVIHMHFMGEVFYDDSGRPVLMKGTGQDISKRKESEIALAESEARWRSLVENAPDIIMMADTEGRILFINSTPAGLSPDKALGTKLYDYVPHEHHETVRRSIERVFRTGEPDSYEIAARGPYDGISWYSTRVGPIKRNGVVVSVILITRDITRRKKTEEALVSEYALRKAIEDSLRVGVSAVDMEGRHTYVNPAFCEMMGWEKDELMGTSPPYVYWPPEEVENIAAELNALLDGTADKKNLELRYMRKNGERFDALVIPSPLRGSNGDLIGWLASFYDISERKRIEERLREMSITDELTGLLNRRGFMMHADKRFQIAQRDKGDLVLFFADLDNLKSINDTRGHKVGDEALKETAKIIRNTFRLSDIIGRIGGDEFSVLLTGTAAMEDETSMINRLEENLASIRVNERELSLSAGVVRYDPGNIKSIDELISIADSLMYAHKKKKRGH